MGNRGVILAIPSDYAQSRYGGCVVCEWASTIADHGEVRSSGKAGDLVDWMENHGFHLCNSQGEVTFLRPYRDSVQSSVLDLTWANDAAVSNGSIGNWSVSPDLHAGSDHLPLTWTSFVAKGYSDPKPPDLPTYRYDDEAAGEWTTAFLAELAKPLSRVLPVGDAHSRVEHLMSAMSTASRCSLELSGFHPRASPWFTKEVAKALEEVRQARLRLRLGSKGPQTDPSQHDLTLLRTCQRRQKRMIRKAKRDWAMAFAGEVTRKDVWRLTLSHMRNPSPLI